MRYVRYPNKGKPNQLKSRNFDELLLITLAALSVSNTERRLTEYFLDNEASIKPIREKLKSKEESYEVSVVENFYKLGQANFALHGSIPIWERAIQKKSIDISLFNIKNKEESRIEFGFYSKKKLKRMPPNYLTYIARKKTVLTV